jgi:hypothetical protein
VNSSCWSTRFDEITDPYIKVHLLRDRKFTATKLRELIQEVGGTEEFLRQFEEQKNILENLQGQGQSTAEEFGEPHPIDQLILFAEGGIEMASCMSGIGPSSDGESSVSTLADSKSRLPDAANCKALRNYRDTQLVKDLDIAINKYSIFRAGMLKQEEYARTTSNLMNDEWWGGEKRARIAIEIKALTDLFQDTVGWFAPVENLGVKIVQAGAVTIDVLKTEEEEGAKAAAAETWTDILKELAKKNGSFLGLGMDAIAYKERLERLASSKEEVQQRVRDIERTVNSFHSKMIQSKARAQAIGDLVAQIDHACSSSTPQINLTPR